MNRSTFSLKTAVAACCALMTLPACANPSAIAQSAPPAQTAATVEAAPVPANDNIAKPAIPSRPALWKVADTDTTIYVFGTIHVLPDGVDWLNGKVATAFAESDLLVTEIIEGDPAEMQGLVIKKAMLPQGKTLRGLLSDKEKAAYEAVLGQYKVPPTLFDRFDLWYAAVGLSTLPLMQEGYTPENGVEQLLTDRAKARKLDHQALETAEYQLDLFDGLPLDTQRRYLGEVIEQLPTIKNDLQKMVEAWRTGDAIALVKLMNADKSDPVLVKALLTDRNAIWAKWVDARLEKPGTVFLAVGAGHLAGTGSLQEQLADLKINTVRLQ